MTRKLGVNTLIIIVDAATDLLACVDCHCLAARRTARAITRDFEAKLRPHGLRATQFSILAALAVKGPTSTTEIAEVLGLERTTLTRSAAVLQRNGWIEAAESTDPREHPLRLTQVGRQRLEDAFPAWKEAQELVSRKLERGEYRRSPRDPGDHRRRPRNSRRRQA